MRKSMLAISVLVLGTLMLMSSMAYGVGVVEDFEGYTVPPGPGYTTDWYWFVNDSSPYFASWVADGDPGAGVDKAAWYRFDSVNLNRLIPNTIRLQTDLLWGGVLDPALVAGTFSGLADVVGATAPETVVSAVHFYIGIDDGIAPYGDFENPLYVSPALTRSNSNPSGWEYEDTFSLLDGTDQWELWNWNGTRYVASGTYAPLNIIPTTTTDDMLVAGLQFDVPAFAATGPTYFDIWADNISLVPEPGALLLACFGAIGILMRRGRRQMA